MTVKKDKVEDEVVEETGEQAEAAEVSADAFKSHNDYDPA